MVLLIAKRLQSADARDLTERCGFVDCQTSPVTQLQSESVSDTLNKGKEEPLSNLEEKLATSLLRRKQNSSADKHIVSYKTGGLPLTYMQIPKSRKSVSKSMQPKRSRVMESARSAMAGTSNQQLLAQHKAELKRMNSELKSGLRESVFKEQTIVNKKVTLALKNPRWIICHSVQSPKEIVKASLQYYFGK